jgi:hypothetical protein
VKFPSPSGGALCPGDSWFTVFRLWECAVPRRRDGMVSGMHKSDYKLSRRAHGPMRGATGCGRGVGGLPRHAEGRDLALARSRPATVTPQRPPCVVRAQRERGGTTVACRHAPRTTPCGCHSTSNAGLHADRTARRFGRGARAAKGTQVHKVQRVRAKAQAPIPSQAPPPPRAPGGMQAGVQRGGLRATRAGRAHPSVRSRSGG